MRPINRQHAVRLPPWLRIVREATQYDATIPTTRVRTPEDVAQYLRPVLAVEETEVFVVLALDTQSRIRACQTVTRGLLDSSLVHPREVFRLAVALGAAGIIVAHNHPSGDPTPSPEDRAITRQLLAAGQLLDILVYDHIIIAADRSLSFAQAGLL